MPAMELQTTILDLDALAGAARRHAAPEDLELVFDFQSPLGPGFIGLEEQAPVDGSDDRWMGSFLYWGHNEDGPAGAPYAMELAAVKDGGATELLGCVGGEAYYAWEMDDEPDEERCKGRFFQWPALRRAVLGGCSLRAVITVLPPADAVATLDAALRIENNLGDTIAAIGPMLDNDSSSDVAVTAGGRTFRAHRLVLVAASPVFRSMLDGAMREAREAAVELVGADAGVVELLLRHVYGCAIEVPASLALQLYALADQYQLTGGLQQRLRLWLTALRLAPEALCELAPAACTLCSSVFYGGPGARRAVAAAGVCALAGRRFGGGDGGCRPPRRIRSCGGLDGGAAAAGQAEARLAAAAGCRALG
ncbi:hypothetical protein Rsub_02227 [Raphidocelis subcapitata]|uniref:BTB domain-containing protein n=1 Tax=Raphidocelis subcapitata TaxID=307507 RepID=A0A2V0NPZ7_9CHLO|nr:hypothetical protein Rsub_02227 [Raphidocelis subcapitata]|eukprot:GBF89349.1 hypothetical protein Rsub_02227 [Raphidocelis subcapitata]